MVGFGQWIAQSALSQWLQVQGWWLVPFLQSVHILAIAVVMSSLLMVNMRLLGLSGSGLTVPQISLRYLPWMWWALPILAVTGVLMIVIEPVRSLDNSSFWIKMALLVIAIAMMWRFQDHANRNPGYWEDVSNRGRIKAYVTVSMVVWVGIIFGGRWIGYVNS